MDNFGWRESIICQFFVYFCLVQQFVMFYVYLKRRKIISTKKFNEKLKNRSLKIFLLAYDIYNNQDKKDTYT